MSNIKELRNLINPYQSLESMSISETIEMFGLNEAFFGRKPVSRIQKAMNDCYRVIMNNPQVDMFRTRESQALSKSFMDVFGFGHCFVYWKNDPAFPTAYTFPKCKWLHSSGPAAQSYTYGENSKGFYDKEHSLEVFIHTDQNLFTSANLTPEEMVAILLHEIGHNFDYSPYTLIFEWYRVFSLIIAFCMNPSDITPLSSFAINTLVRECNGVMAFLHSIDNMILNIIPPIGYIVRLVQKLGFNVIKLIQAVISPITVATLIPIHIMMTPFRYLSNFELRVSETYADSFAASYGYGAELGTGLNKIMKESTYTGPGSDSFLLPFYDLAMMQSEIITLCTGGHGSTQQRFKRCIDKLDEDLENANLTSKDKAMIKAERDRIINTYNSFVNCEDDTRMMFTRAFREMIDNWYAGKNYLIAPIVGREIRYAK